MNERPKIIPSGNVGKALTLEAAARFEMTRLQEDMSFQNLKTGVRERILPSGDKIRCIISQGEKIASISAVKDKKEKEEKSIWYQFYLKRSDGTEITSNTLSYLVLYNSNRSVIFRYDYLDSTGDPIISLGNGLFKVEVRTPEPVWAFYACHEDITVWGNAHIVRNGLRTQWPFRYRTTHQFQPGDMITPWSVYKDVIPYGCFKFSITGEGLEGNQIDITGGLKFEVFDESGLNVNLGAYADFILSQWDADQNALSIYNEQIVFPEQWGNYIETVSGNGFWVFILDDLDEGTSGHSGGDVQIVNRPSKCSCADITDDDTEEYSSYENVSDIIKDGRLQYLHKCTEDTQNDPADLIPPIRDLREDTLCGSGYSENMSTVQDAGGRNNCANWVCLSLIRNCDMKPVVPNSLADKDHVAVSNMSFSPVTTGEYLTPAEAEEYTGEDPEDDFFKAKSFNSGMGYGYGRDMDLNRNVWTVALPGVVLDWDGQPTDFWLLKPMTAEEVQDYEDRRNQGVLPKRKTEIVFVPYSQVEPDDIYYNQQTENFEIYVGPHPAPYYRGMYQCEGGLLTMYQSFCCWKAGSDNFVNETIEVSDNGENDYFDYIFCTRFTFVISLNDVPLTEGVSFSVYDETGLEILTSDDVQYSSAEGGWVFDIGGDRACPTDRCADLGVYVVYTASGGKPTLYKSICSWTSVTEGELLKPGKYHDDLCVDCPGCGQLLTIGGYSLSEYSEHVSLGASDSLSLVFNSSTTESCTDFINSLSDGLPAEFAGSFAYGGSSGTTFTVDYTASSRLCNEYDKGKCPVICGYAIPCCCSCNETDSPVLSAQSCSPDSCKGKYLVTDGCPSFQLWEKPDGDDWSTVLKSNFSECDSEDSGGSSSCWFCYECDCSTEGSCPSSNSFEIKVTDSLSRDSNVLTYTQTVTAPGYVSFSAGSSPSSMTASSSAPVTVVGGAGPFSWSVSGTGFSMQEASTESRSNMLIAGASACGLAEITVTDTCGDSVAMSTQGPGEWIVSTETGCVLGGTGTVGYVNGNAVLYQQNPKWKVVEKYATCYSAVGGSCHDNSFYLSYCNGGDPACSGADLDFCFTNICEDIFSGWGGEPLCQGGPCPAGESTWIQCIYKEWRKVCEWGCSGTPCGDPE